MPWTGPQFGSRHNHSLTPEQAAHAARIANAILRRGAPEGESIATANKLVQHRDYGGGVDTTDPSTASYAATGTAPTAQTMSPLMQGMIQRYSSMSPEQLQQLAVMMGGSPQGQVIQHILQQKRLMPQQQMPQQQQQRQAQPAPTPQQQAQQVMQQAAQQPQQQASGGIIAHRDMGGVMSLSMADPSWTRQEQRGADASSNTGFLHGNTAGRADAISGTAPAGSYVLPADVVSGLGEGNSLAGARAVEEMLSTGPHGIPMPRSRAGMGPPRPPAPFHEAQGGFVPAARMWKGPTKLYRAGGVPGRGNEAVALSDGEFVVPPEHVAKFGGGDHGKGIKALDDFVLKQRAKHIAKLKSLPPPVGAKK